MRIHPMNANKYAFLLLIGLIQIICSKSFVHKISYRHAVSRQFLSTSSSVNTAKDNFDERTVVILLHKPPNVVTSHRSDDSRSTVYDLVRQMDKFIPPSISQCSSNNKTSVLSFEHATNIRSKLHSIGRLDADTRGLILITNDGGLVHHVTNPTASTHLTSTATATGPITKTYEATIMGHHTISSLQPLVHGIDIGAKYGGITRPVNDLTVLHHPNHKSTVVSISIEEGRNRQIRRMFHALGSGVMHLKRTKMGKSLTLEGVEEEGKWRVLEDWEVREKLGWEPRALGKVDSFNRETPSKRRNEKKRCVRNEMHLYKGSIYAATDESSRKTKPKRKN